jgi:hypothetical protein|nr:MAG TPA: hypothetical protein [Caudoviricetes sp.]
MFDFGLPAGNQSNIEALITRLGIGQQQQMPVTQPRTVINDLDELFADLSTDQRKAVESNEDYNIALGNLLQKYLMYSLSHTAEGTQFILNPGRKLAQNLLDTTKRVVADLDKQKTDEFQSMGERISQLEAFIVQQNKIMQDQDTKLKEQALKLEEFKTSLGGE